jgi:hypothetical protein
MAVIPHKLAIVKNYFWLIESSLRAQFTSYSHFSCIFLEARHYRPQQVRISDALANIPGSSTPSGQSTIG